MRYLGEKLSGLSFKRAMYAIRLLKNLDGYLALRRQLASSSFKSIAQENPETVFKFLMPYLSLSLTLRERLDAIRNHYDCFDVFFRGSSDREFPSQGLRIWTGTGQADRFALRLAPTCGWFLEGDLNVEFSMNSITLYTMTITVVPGRLLGLECRDAMFIGGSQGIRDGLALNRMAAKANGEIRPATMVLLAVQSLAKAMRVESVVGVSARDHSLVSGRTAVPSAYDPLWIAHGGHPIGRYFRIPEQPVYLSSPASASHRARTNRKRAMKEALLSEIFANIERHFYGRVPQPSRAEETAAPLLVATESS
jgi:uncharacterized protein VirK/YbjX